MEIRAAELSFPQGRRATFGGLDANPELAELLRTALPELPDDPAPEQVAAWFTTALRTVLAGQSKT